MASVINTNMASLVAQKNLSTSQSAMATSVERLSSGLRINRAKDDAAGLGVSEKLTTQIRTINQAARNAGDAISMVQTAEGALSEVSTMLQRMKELSTQASSDALDNTQRGYIASEITSLKDEINQIATRTTFNGKTLLNGSAASTVSTANVTGAATFKTAEAAAVKGSLTFTLGPVGLDNATPTYDVGDQIQISIGGATAVTFDVDTVAGGTAADDITVDDMVSKFNEASGFGAANNLVASKDTDGKLVITSTAAGVALAGTFVDKADAAAADGTYSRTSAAATAPVAAATAAGGKVTFGTDANYAAGSQIKFTVEGGSEQTFTVGQDMTKAQLATAINNAVTSGSLTGVNAAVNGGGNLELTSTNTGKNLNGSASVKSASTGTNLDFQVGALTTDSLAIGSFKDIRLGGNGSGDATVFNDVATALTTFSTTATTANAKALEDKVGLAIDTISGRRAELGALQNRLDHNIANLQAQSENLQASRSRIMDTDYAAETAQMTKTQILQQAATAMLAQANQAPNVVLSLLK